MLGLSPLELAVIAALALALFGPDKLPGAVRETGRIMRHIRSMSENARAELLDQLGPEIAGLDPRRLDPRALVRENLTDALEPLASAGREVRSELSSMRDAARFDEHAHRLAAVEAAAFAPGDRGPRRDRHGADPVVPSAASGPGAGTWFPASAVDATVGGTESASCADESD